MSNYADEIKRLTGDAGARRLGEIVDDLTARIAILQARVDACCDSAADHANVPAAEVSPAKPTPAPPVTSAKEPSP